MVIFLNFLKIKIMEFYKTYTSVVYKDVQNFVPFQLLQHDNVNWRGTLYLTSNKSAKLKRPAFQALPRIKDNEHTTASPWGYKILLQANSHPT